MTKKVHDQIEVFEEALKDSKDKKYILRLYVAGEQIIAAPTLVKKLPPPLRRFIGNMSDVDRILVGLDLKPKEKVKSED